MAIYQKDTANPVRDEVICVLHDEDITIMQVGEVHVVAGLCYIVMSFVRDGMIYRRELEANENIPFASIKTEARRFYQNVVENGR